MEPRSIAFHHFGCKVNFAEASSLSRQFKENGFSLKDFREVADVYVISTCVVTAVAEKKCRAAIRQAHHLNPEAKIAVIGCFPELMPDELAKMEGVSLVLGHSAKFSLFEEVNRIFEPSGYGHPVLHDPNDFVSSWSFGDRTRSFIKIQDGCDYYCSYCTIPLARGHSRSDTIANVIHNVNQAAQAGVKEIVLTGVNIGDFGRNRDETFFDLVRELEKGSPIKRIRVSSIEPDLLNDKIIEFIASSEKFMPHFHIPLQSGSDKILKLMKRKYSRELFSSRIRKIREHLPLACIATDVIVGFPGETEADFGETLDFIRGIDLSYAHVFSYSKRENTLAAGMDEPVQDKIKKYRSEALHQLSEEKKSAFYHQNKGLTKSVLFESDNSGGFMHGFTENYIKVKTPYDENLVNQIVSVKLDVMDKELCFIV
ncbi:MAG: tRNA (N(6)-L-threonylcarbamoyladenosine(37)-C(2))-methylthiotransferase MtaB [Bacteroidetes bacterium]|nr:tRNA (N(6)-L-threonylcarbamoyladenosine(37)-C(2))-methylthiotransferase MtaB [Bacteroidota bacterium]